MESNSRESVDAKPEFRKPSNDASNRKYRRRSPDGGSLASSDGSPHGEHSLSPVPSRKDIAKIADDKHTRDDGRSQSGRSGESYKHSDRQSSWSYHKRDDRSRREKHVEDYDRGYSKSSYRSRLDREHRPRDYATDGDKSSRTKSEGSGHRSRDRDSYERAGSGRRHANTEERDRDGDRDRHREDRGDRYRKTDLRKSSADRKNDHSPSYEESRGQRNDSSSRRGGSGHRLKEASQRDGKELDVEGYMNDEKRRLDDQVALCKDQCSGGPKEHSADLPINGADSVAKKPKISSLDNTSPGTGGTSEQACVTDSDIDAAKIAAMKAAELVNRNLVGTGYMSTDQKKKLLWGNKKNTATEESTHRWDTTTFGDRERQEKFNKLMGVKGDGKVELKPDNPNVEKQREELQVELEKQYTAGLRRRDGRTVGLGL